MLLCAWAGYVWGTLPDVSALETKNPSTTALIEERMAEARAEGRRPRRQQKWVQLSDVPKHVVDAVLISEDDRFYEHDGLDLKETRAALEQAWEKKQLGRGASTLTQQLAKNLWLSTERSVLRKAKELILARRLEERLSKRRILTLYLNVAEWGEGVYGLEAAARVHFGVSASELSVAQGAILAAMLPAPRTWTPASGSPRLKERAVRIVDRLGRYGRVSPDVAAAARTEVLLRLEARSHSAGAES